MPYLVCVDPGHRNNDLDWGATDGTGTNDYLTTKEAVVALAASYYLRAALMRCGIEVVMTRYDSTTTRTLEERYTIANASGADRCVCMHFNSATLASARGIEVLCYSPGTTANMMATYVYDQCNNLTPWVDRGVKFRSDLSMLNDTKMPAIVVEGGFLSNTEEEILISTPDYQFRLGEAVAKGICRSLNVPYIAPSPKDPTSYEAEIAALQIQIKDASTKLAAANQTVATLKNSLAIEQAKTSAQLMEIANLNALANGKNILLDQMQVEVTVANAKVASLTGTIDSLMSQRQKLQDEINTLHADVTVLETTINTYSGSVKLVRDALALLP